jgi:hypothetical protein
MFKTIRAILATPDTAAKAADAVFKGADASWFTKEEQAEWYLRYLEATQPQNLSRRYISLVITMIWALSTLSLLGAIFIGMPERAGEILNLLSTVVNPVFFVVITFYFAKGIADTVWAKDKGTKEQ